jgi:anthranilate synthase component 1
MDGDVTKAPEDLPTLLASLRGALSRCFHPVSQSAKRPFSGGLVGVAAYDLARWIERLPERLEPRAGEPQLALLAPESILAFDHLTRKVALFHAGSEEDRRVLRDEVIEALRSTVPSPPRGGSF